MHSELLIEEAAVGIIQKAMTNLDYHSILAAHNIQFKDEDLQQVIVDAARNMIAAKSVA